MNRFFVEPNQIHSGMVRFPADLTHQIKHVLRLKPGESVEVLDNSGQVYLVELLPDLDAAGLRARVLEFYPAKREPETHLCLCFGMTRREKVELILQKATEIGVSSFLPFISSRTLVQSNTLSEKRRKRWESIIREAAEQSGRGRLPILHVPQSFSEVLDKLQEMRFLSLLAWEGADVQTAHLSTVNGLAQSVRLALIVGPEGGFTELEIEQALTHSCRLVSLGSTILRMETAAMVFPALALFANRSHI